MSNIEDLKKSISEMTTEELQLLHRSIRQNRRTHKPKPTKRKKPPAVLDLSAMSDATKADILKTLQDMKETEETDET